MTQTESTEAAPMLTSVTDVQRYIELLEVLVRDGDYETASGLERSIWGAVLEAIASCNAQAGWIAAEALKTKAIDFPR